MKRRGVVRDSVLISWTKKPKPPRVKSKRKCRSSHCELISNPAHIFLVCVSTNLILFLWCVGGKFLSGIFGLGSCQESNCLCVLVPFWGPKVSNIELSSPAPQSKNYFTNHVHEIIFLSFLPQHCKYPSNPNELLSKNSTIGI